MTVNDCGATRPPESRAVPTDTPVSVTSEPATDVDATSGDDEAAYSSASPSGSLKCADASTISVPSTSTVAAPIADTTPGARFGCGSGG